MSSKKGFMTTFKKLYSQKIANDKSRNSACIYKTKLDCQKGPNWVQLQQKNTQWDLMERELRLLKNFHSLSYYRSRNLHSYQITSQAIF